MARPGFITLPLGMKRILMKTLVKHPELRGLKPGSSAYVKRLERLAAESATDSLHAILPPERFEKASNPRRKKVNPYTAQVPEKIYGSVPLFSGEASIFVKSDLPQDELKAMYRDFRSTVVRLTNLYCQLLLGHEGDRSYDMKKGMSEADQKQIWVNRFERLLVLQFVLGSLEPVFSLPGSTVRDGLKRLGFSTANDLEFLSSGGTREQFLKAARSDVKTILSGVDFRKILAPTASS